MRKKRYRPEQIIAKMYQADILLNQSYLVAQVIKSLEISEFTYYRWPNEYSGMITSQAKRLKGLEEGNTRLGGSVSDLTLDFMIMSNLSPSICRAKTSDASTMKICVDSAYHH